MVLYHAVSSYQLLEVMLHRIAFHEKEKAILILPDFITGKYPQYKKLKKFLIRSICSLTCGFHTGGRGRSYKMSSGTISGSSPMGSKSLGKSI